MVTGLRTKVSLEPWTEQRLELYLLRNNGTVHRCHCNILECMDHMKRWRETPNPHAVLNEATSHITWEHIVHRLRQFDIDVNKLDLELYEELRACDTYNALTTKLLEIQRLRRSGALEERSRKWKQEGWREYDEKLKKKARDEVYVGNNNKRFSHAFPLGIDVHELEEMTLTKALQSRYVEPELPELVVLQEEPQDYWQLCKAKVGGWLMYPAWRYIIVTIVLLGGLLGGFAYIQFQHEGCGDDCLAHD